MISLTLIPPQQWDQYKRLGKVQREKQAKEAEREKDKARATRRKKVLYAIQ